MDIEITNIEYEWRDYPDDPLAQPEIIVTCGAINYGGSGHATIVVVANASNASTSIEKVACLAQNEQLHLEFYRKIPYEPLNITGYSKRELLDIISPSSEDLDVEIVNLFYEALGWIDDEKTELEVTVYATAINYEHPGYITVVIELAGEGFSKKIEERIFINWYEQFDLVFQIRLPAQPTNITAYTKRPQPS